MYADDTILYLAGPPVHNLIFSINQDLQCLSEWLEDNNLVLNVSKTKFILFTSQRHKRSYQRYCLSFHLTVRYYFIFPPKCKGRGVRSNRLN